MRKAAYDFNRSIGYGIQFADMMEVSAALKDKREAEITISKNRDEILKNPEAKEIKYDSKDQAYKVYDKNDNVMTGEIYQKPLKEITKAANTIQEASITIDSYKNYRNEAVRDEIGIETKIREMDQYIDTNSEAGKRLS